MFLFKNRFSKLDYYGLVGVLAALVLSPLVALIFGFAFYIVREVILTMTTGTEVEELKAPTASIFDVVALIAIAVGLHFI
jgi:phosphate/sulfate permease